jgi:biotin operon repressor
LSQVRRVETEPRRASHERRGSALVHGVRHVVGGRAVEGVGSLRGAVLERLRSRPLSTVELRDLLKVRKASVLQALSALRSDGLVQRADHGWALTTPPLMLALDE